MADHDRPLEVECRRAMGKWQHLEAWLSRSDKDIGADYGIRVWSGFERWSTLDTLVKEVIGDR